jgi:hypothetical protein
MCNANNHPPFCECGWGGGNNTGGARAGTANRTPGIYIGRKLVDVAPKQLQDGKLTYYHFSGRNFCKKSKCQYCGSDVYFIRHNDGCAFFDELGYPWPKHDCLGMSQNMPQKNFFSKTEAHNVFFKGDKMGKILKIYKDRMYMQYLIQISRKQLIFLEAKIKDAIFQYDDLVLVRIQKGSIHLIKKDGMSAIAQNVEQKHIGELVRSGAEKMRDVAIDQAIHIEHTYEGFIDDIGPKSTIVRLNLFDAEVHIKNLPIANIKKYCANTGAQKVPVKVKITHKSIDRHGVDLIGSVVEFL